MIDLKPAIILMAVVFTTVFSGCGGTGGAAIKQETVTKGIQTTDRSLPSSAKALPSRTQLPSPNLTRKSKANPIPEPIPAAIQPTPATLPTSTTIKPGPEEPSASLKLPLKIVEVISHLPSYDRRDWKHWIDEDRDCQNTRHEVLIEESLKAVTFKSGKRCQVATGEWLAPFTGDTVTDATKLDVDHMVPLKNAHDSGGWAWDKSRKSAYANEMAYSDHLIAVTASANRKKGAKGPEGWKPSNRDYWCDYAVDWVQIKVDWGLSAIKAEWEALQEMLARCDSPPSITAIPSKAEPPPTAKPVTPVTTPAPPATPGVVDVLITSLDCKGKPEIVVIENAGTSAQDMTGWKVEDRGPKYTFSFPAGFSLGAGASVELVSGASGDDTGETIYWNNRPVWNNDGDTASLIDSSGLLAFEMKCP